MLSRIVILNARINMCCLSHMSNAHFKLSWQVTFLTKLSHLINELEWHLLYKQTKSNCTFESMEVKRKAANAFVAWMTTYTLTAYSLHLVLSILSGISLTVTINKILKKIARTINFRTFKEHGRQSCK